MAEPFVRPYNASTDLANLVHIFRETCDSGLKIEPVWTIGSYFWCRPYPVLSPSTCFVLDDGNGRSVGYVLGTPDTARFCESWHSSYLPVLKVELDSLPLREIQNDALAARSTSMLDLLRHNPQKSLYSDFAEQLRSWPGHLHIDILPSHQRRGYGKMLLDKFLNAVKAEGCTGVYLGMVASNSDAGRFYETYGFDRLPHVLDGGTTGEMGRTNQRVDGNATIYYVIDL